MRSLLAAALLSSASVIAAPPDTRLPPPEATRSACADCGVVRSVRAVTKELRADPAKSDARPSGLVASVPFGGGKIEAGSSSKIGKDAPTTSETWEVVIRLDDGRFRVLNVTEPPEVQAGDKVRVEANGRISLRAD